MTRFADKYPDQARLLNHMYNLVQTYRGDELKGCSEDGKYYLSAQDCANVADAFAKAAESLRATTSEAQDMRVTAGTLFECRCCSRSVSGRTDGSFDQPGWARIAGIDGPNAICPECRADPTALDALKADGYENARIVGEVGA